MFKQTTLFNFLKYIKPIWYFNLEARSSSYFVDSNKLSAEQKKYLQYDTAYHSEVSRAYDLAYQSFHKGLITFTVEDTLSSLQREIPLEDEYYFIRKYFNATWSWYILVLRLIAFRNPFIELRAFLRHRKVKRLNVFSDSYQHEKVNLTEKPLVSVVLPTLNRYAHLKNILTDLQQQHYTNFEVIVVDQSDPFQPDFYKSFTFPISVIHQAQPGLWKARNRAVREAKGELIAFTEDDVRIKPDWLIEHLICLNTFNVDISAGVFFPQGSQPGPSQTFYHWADQFASGNALVKKDVFRKVGLFDLQFERMRMGDGEFGMRCYLHGIKSVSNPFAFCEDVKAPEGGLRQMGSWDAFRSKNWFAPRPVPSVLYMTRKYFGVELSILELLIKVPQSVIPYKFKRNKVYTLLGSFFAILVFPVVLIQVIQSWRAASRMLKVGHKIESL